MTSPLLPERSRGQPIRPPHDAAHAWPRRAPAHHRSQRNPAPANHLPARRSTL